jgi:hypothetical protein
MPTVSRITGQTVQPGDSVYDQRTGSLTVFNYAVRPNNGHDGQVWSMVRLVTQRNMAYVSTQTREKRTMPFAQYKEEELVMFTQGVHIVVRHSMYPHTHFTDTGPVTRQGHAVTVGIRQGGVHSTHRYEHADTAPSYMPAGWSEQDDEWFDRQSRRRSYSYDQGAHAHGHDELGL